jgi:outer membrane protein assembly factor BamB/thioredoxin-like negative regulator of GroEL
LCAASILLLTVSAQIGFAQSTKTTPITPPSSRTLDSLPKNRAHRILLGKARLQLDRNKPTAALTLLQVILDSPADSFLLHNGELHTVRRISLELIRSHPAAGTRRYQALYQQTANAMLRDAVRLQGVQRIVALQHVVRRHLLTSAGFHALNQLATTWLDQGHTEVAWRALRMLALEPSHRSKLTPAIRLKIDAACQITGLPQPPISRSGLNPRRQELGQLNLTPATDWPLPFGPLRANHTSATPAASAPRLSEAWHTRLSDSSTPSPLIPWSAARSNDTRLSGAIALFPIVVEDQIIVRDQQGIRGLSLATGSNLWHYSSPCSWPMRHRAFNQLVPVLRSGTDRFALAVTGNPRFGMITSDGQQVYAVQLAKTPAQLPLRKRTPRISTHPESPWPSQLIALPLPTNTATNTAARQLKSVRPAWRFPSPSATKPPIDSGLVTVLGPASPSAGLLLVLIEQRRQIDLAALSPSNGRLLWTQPLVHTETSLTDARGAIRHAVACLPCPAAGLAICPTGTGVTVSVNLVDGTLGWAHDARAADGSTAASRNSRTGLLNPPRGDSGLANLPLVYNDHVLLLSPQATTLASVHIETGRTRWTRDRDGLEYVAACTPENLLVVGPQRVAGIDPVSGQLRWQRRPGLVSGRGVRLGQDRYLLPLKSGRLICLEIDTGNEIGLSLPPNTATNTATNTAPATASSDPIGRPSPSNVPGGNLVAAGNWILSLTADRITAYPQAIRELNRIQAELAADPKNDQLQLSAAEATLALGKHDQSRRLLDSIVDSRDPRIASRGRLVLRELLFLQLASTGSNPDSLAAGLLQRLAQLAETPLDTARVLVHEARWHLDQDNPLLAFASASRLASLDTFGSGTPDTQGMEITTDRDRVHTLSRRNWITALSRQSLRMARTRDSVPDRSLLLRLERDAAAVARSKSIDEQLAFVRRHAGNPLADAVRLQAADRLVNIGRFQQAELLLLAIRDRGLARRRLAATIALVNLWSRLGFYEECTPLFDELTSGQLARVDGINGAAWVSRRPADDLAVAAWRRHRHPTPVATRVAITRDATISARSGLPQTYQQFSRRFNTSERSTFDLLETYTGSTRRVILVDRQVGSKAGHIDLPTQFSAPIWWHQSQSGHLLPLGSHSSMLGLSLLHRNQTRPLWTRTFAPLASRPEMLRVGPSGLLAVTFQSRQHLLAVSPIDGELLWRRSDLEPGCGSYADAASGFFGDDHVLVVSRADRIGHDVFDTLTGQIQRHSRLPINSRTRRRAFGRHLMYVTVETNGAQRIRVWDPRDDSTVIDELLKDRIFPVATPDHHLAWIDAAGRLKVHDLHKNSRLLDLNVLARDAPRISSIKVFRDRDCYYLAMLPTQGVAAPRPSNTPVYFVGDTLLPVTHVHGQLLAIDIDRKAIRWSRTVALRSVIRFRHDHLPALVLLGRTRDRGRGGIQRMLIELIDTSSGRTLLLDDSLPTDRMVLAWYDPTIPRLEMQGLKSRITIGFQAD